MDKQRTVRNLVALLLLIFIGVVCWFAIRSLTITPTPPTPAINQSQLEATSSDLFPTQSRDVKG